MGLTEPSTNVMLMGFLPLTGCRGMQNDCSSAPTSQSPEFKGTLSGPVLYAPPTCGLDPGHTQSANNGAFEDRPAPVNVRQYPRASGSTAMAAAGGLAIQPLNP